MFPVNNEDQHCIQQKAALYRAHYPAFAVWAKGYGVIQHTDETQIRVFDLCQQLLCQGRFTQLDELLDIFVAADRLTSAAMWMVANMTYADKVYLDGRSLQTEDFKDNPQGHTGGSLNMVPGYLGYMAANTLTGQTRSWMMGQGHCVAAIDSVNVLLGNLCPDQAARYRWDEQGLSQLASDFYSYAINDDGKPGVPLGSHVNPHTAGGLIEGGYLGFAELQYVHMPLPGENLVAFLSDGAFEEQRGSDWASRWWRAEDCGLVTPVMIANGRRIDQRSTMYQQGGMEWFFQHLQLNGFYPITIDGRDPAAFIWGIFETETRLQACAEQVRTGHMAYPVKLPYLIAETVKGFGFYGAGTNAAHGTPLPKNPRHDELSRQYFNDSSKQLFVSLDDTIHAVSLLNSHDRDNRQWEKNHPLSQRDVSLSEIPLPQWISTGTEYSPMEAVDYQFTALVENNPDLRVRVGNPDELRSNRMGHTLDKLKHRVLQQEDGVAESIHGAVITALNEEAVVSAALANKGGINLVATYEAFAVKMLGAIRQEIIFARHQKDLGRALQWLSVPVIATSHVWENGKNEQSHQDPLFGEALMGEMSDVSRVVYPADANTAIACLNACYQTQGQIWAMTIPKQPVNTLFDEKQAEQLVTQGALSLGEINMADVQLVAVGAYQLDVCLQVQGNLAEKGVSSCVTYMLEPGRFRQARDKSERAFIACDMTRMALFPSEIKLRVFVTHLRPEKLIGICRPLDLGPERCFAFGYTNQGGTLDTNGLLSANGCDIETVSMAVTERLLVLKR
jgi:phosphoketolase